MMLITLAMAGIAVQAEDKPVKTPEGASKPAIKKPAADGQPVVKKPAPDGTKPAIKKLPADPNKPAVKKPAPDPTKPVVKKPAPDGTKPVIKKPDGKKPGANVKPGGKKPGANNAKDEFTGILNRCDDDKNGSVSLDEFKSHSGAKDPASVEKWFTGHDVDKNGQLTASDFAPPPPKK